MKKRNKKMWIVLIIALISAITLMALQASAVSSKNFDDVEFSSPDITEEKLEQIIKSMYGISDGNTIQPFSIFCIFGHSIQTGTIISTEHRVFSTNPRCRSTVSNVQYCTRNSCSHFVIIRQAVSIIGCCN